MTNDPQKRRGKTDLVPCGLALAAQAKPYGIRRPSTVIRFPCPNPRAVCRPDLVEKPCQSHMAACSPSRYVAEVRGVSNPHFAYSKDKTAHDGRQGRGAPAIQLKAGIGKDFSDLPGLAGADFQNNMPGRQQVITCACCNRTIAVEAIPPAIQRATRVPVLATSGAKPSISPEERYGGFEIIKSKQPATPSNHDVRTSLDADHPRHSRGHWRRPSPRLPARYPWRPPARPAIPQARLPQLHHSPYRDRGYVAWAGA